MYEIGPEEQTGLNRWSTKIGDYMCVSVGEYLYFTMSMGATDILAPQSTLIIEVSNWDWNAVIGFLQLILGVCVATMVSSHGFLLVPG